MKWIRRLLGLVVSLGFFGCTAVVVVIFSTGLLDITDFIQVDGQLAPPDLSGEGVLPTVPDVTVPQVGVAPGEVVTLGDQVAARPLLSNVPAPSELSTEQPVISANVFLAIIMALLFGFVTTVLGNMLRDEEETIRAFLEAIGIFKLLPKGAAWWSRRSITRTFFTLPLIVFIFALYGILFALLEKGTQILSQSGAFLAVTLAFSVGMVSMAGDFSQRFVAWLWREDSHFRIYPANLLIAGLSVVLSRVIVLSPGLIFGTPGGVDVKVDEARQGRRVTLSLVTVATVIAVGALGWSVSEAIATALQQPLDSRVADATAGLIQAAQNTSLAIFLVALETVFFELVPLAYGLGQTIFRWSKIVWAILFVPVAFLFNHALLNPDSGFLDSFSASNVRFMWFMLFVLSGMTGALWLYFNVLRGVLSASGNKR